MAHWSLIGVLCFVFCVSYIPSRSDSSVKKSAVVSTLQNACLLALRSARRLLLGSADDLLQDCMRLNDMNTQRVSSTLAS